MKWIILIFILFSISIFGSLAYNQYLVQKKQEIFHTNALTYQGTLQEVIPAGGDYTHILITSSGMLRLLGKKVDLNPYVGKNVKVTGQFSGSIFYVDAVEIAIDKKLPLDTP